VPSLLKLHLTLILFNLESPNVVTRILLFPTSVQRADAPRWIVGSAFSQQGNSNMVIVSLVLSLILVIVIAQRSQRIGFREYTLIVFITAIQVGVIVFYLYTVQPPSL
jgi:cytochrome c biogenesis factor